MNKIELLVSLMKLDKAYKDIVIELEGVLGDRCELFEAHFYKQKDDEGKEVKCIREIVLEYAGIPEDDYDTKTEKGFCRDGVSELYYDVVHPGTSLMQRKDFNLTFEIVAEILIGLGEIFSEESLDYSEWGKVSIKKYNELMMKGGFTS